MLAYLLSLARLMRDREARSTLRLLSTFVFEQPRWKREINSRVAKFRCDEEFKVSTFLNSVLAELAEIGVHGKHVRAFRICSAELINNAFRHGCSGHMRGRVRVAVTFSPWFIRIEVTDSGTGFDLDEVLSSQGDPPHGLQIARNLSYHLQTNRRGNRVTAFLALDFLLKIKAEKRTHGGKTILYVEITDAGTWSHMSSNWEPLRHAIEQHPQKRVVIDCRKVQWSTVQTSQTRMLTSTLRQLRHRAFAFIFAEEEIADFKLTHLQSANIKVFPSRADAVTAAMNWLVDVGGEASRQE